MMEKRRGMKRTNLWSRIFTDYKHIIAVVLITGLSATLLYKRSINAASDRAKTAAAVIVGAGVGGGLAGGLGGAKWLPLGFVGGGITLGLIARGAIKRRRARRRAEMEAMGYQEQPSYPQIGRNRRYMNQPMENQYPQYINQNGIRSY